jgi:hypothetical protein
VNITCITDTSCDLLSARNREDERGANVAGANPNRLRMEPVMVTALTPRLATTAAHFGFAGAAAWLPQ